MEPEELRNFHVTLPGIPPLCAIDNDLDVVLMASMITAE
jgi:hypothetical protein